LAQREEIALGRARGDSIRTIAAFLGRSPSTVSRELRRNADRLGRYRATTAHALAYHRASRPKPGKLLTNLRRSDEMRSGAAMVSTLAPSPAWIGWDHPAEKLWPAPDDREGDLNEHPGDRWLDEIGTAARMQLLALDRPAVIGHGDWYSQNLRWIDRRLHVVHDWDSAITQAEAAVAGQAAAVSPGTGLPGEVATVAQSEQFLTAYERASGHSWNDRDIRAAWAAGLWTRAFDAKKASLVGADPAAALTRLKPRNGHGSPDCDHTRPLKEIDSKSSPVLPHEGPRSSP
jgi:hypothetical protein